MTDDKNILEQRDSLIFLTFIVGAIASICTFIGVRRLFTVNSRPVHDSKQVCFCRACCQKNLRSSKSTKNSSWKLWIICATLWCLCAFLVVRISQYPSELNPSIDPYDVLGVTEGASKTEVKKAYRKLVLKKHPDHGGTVEQFMEVSQAYKILTDSATMEYWEKHGKSDGPVTNEYGIALPTWLISEATSPTFVLLYYVVAVLSIPLTSYYLYRKWFTGNSQSVTEDLKPMVQYIFSCLFRSPNTTFKKFIVWFSATPCVLGQKESREPATKRNIGQLEKILRNFEQTFEDSKVAPFNEPVCTEFRVLLQAHLERTCVEGAELIQYQKLVVNQAKILINMVIYSFAEYGPYICQQRKNKSDPQALYNSFKALLQNLPCILQACTMYDSPLMQLPYVTKDRLDTFMRKKKGVRTIENFVRLPEKSRNILLDNLSDEQVEEFYLVLKALPAVSFYARFRVDEQKDAAVATTNSNVYVDFLIKRESFGQFLDEAVVENNKKGRKPTSNQNSEFAKDSAIFPSAKKIKAWAYVFGKKKNSSYQVHCPYFNEQAFEKWWLYTLDGTSNVLMQPIICFDTMEDEMCFCCDLGKLPAGVHKITYVLASAVYLLEQKSVTLRIEIKNEPVIEETHDVSDLSSEGFVDFEVISIAE